MSRHKECKTCGALFSLRTRGDANRRHCSQKCSKRAAAKQTLAFHRANPQAMTAYNKNRLIKNPGAWREKHREDRRRIIEGLGGACVVEGCGVNKHVWLHVDYVPTTRGKPFRHPRHPAYILSHKEDFRLLCANHHYELTLTGEIEGSAIPRQEMAPPESDPVDPQQTLFQGWDAA